MLMQKDENTDINKKEDDQSNHWKFKKSVDKSSEKTKVQNNTIDISWSALEYAHHEKNTIWYVAMGAVAAGFAILAYFINNGGLTAPLAIIVFGFVFGYFAYREPRELEFKIDNKGVSVDGKSYPYTEYKSFMLVQEYDQPSIWLLPLKRFNLIIPIHFHPEDEDIIVETLSNIIPMEARDIDLVTRLMHYLHF